MERACTYTTGLSSLFFHCSRTAAAADGAAGFFKSFAVRQGGAEDAELERRVSLAARNLGDGVQRIVMAAKGKSEVEWKSQLLALLGGEDDSLKDCDLDILLANQNADKFVLRCLENELPPNMIHCLRLLRVLELQHATELHKENEQAKIKPISSKASDKVSRLLCKLCQDASVGEQLRPHLFGLLALSGASYPASGVHVAKAASQVIIAFSEHCLSTSLVYFLHDRKMIVHMTDDIKELIEATKSSASQQSSLSLYGASAEEHGLWAIALSTVVHLVVHSCDHDCQELFNDFTSAKGNDVLKSAILKSRSKNGRKLMELIPLLASCKIVGPKEDGPEFTITPGKAGGKSAERSNQKLALNRSAFDIMEDLMYTSLPLLKEYEKEFEKKPEIADEQSIRDLAAYSLQVANKVRFSADAEPVTKHEFDLSTDLLLGCLQLYSDHVQNFQLLEERTHLLTFYILGFSSFADENTKLLVLKTLEFVVAAVAGSNATQPLGVVGEVFSSLCQRLLLESSTPEVEQEMATIDGLLADADMICETLEKLFQFDSRVVAAMMQGGALVKKVGNIMELILEEANRTKSNWTTTFEDGGKTFSEPPTMTSLDNVCATVCRVWALIMAQQSRRSVSLLHIPNEERPSTANPDLNTLLVTAVKELGDEAAAAASGVFVSIMSSRQSLESLRTDMEYCLNIVNHFGEMIGRMCGVPKVLQQYSSKRPTNKTSSTDDIQFECHRAVSTRTLKRVGGLFTMMKNVLEVSSLAREAFRISGGFESIVRMLLCMGGIALHEPKQEEGAGEGIVANLLTLLTIMLSVVDAGTGYKSREATDPSKVDANAQILIALPVGTLVDPVSTQHSPPSPAAQNKYYLRLKGFYLDLSIAISRTNILDNPEDALQVLDLAMAHMDQSCSVSRVESEKGTKIQSLRNPDAARLVLGLATFLPDTEDGNTLGKRAFDQIIRLCDPSRLGSTLSQIASSGLCWSITNPREFSPLLDDTSHHLHTRFVLLLRRIAAFSMSYNDFVATLRCIAGPLLKDDSADSRLRLPVISSSGRRRKAANSADVGSDQWQEYETDVCRRLESLCTVAERGDRAARCVLGGDSINTISVLLHKTKVEDRLYKAAEDGRLNFMEIESIDSSALKPGGFLSAGTAAPGSSAGGERIWTPLASTGFSYSVWLRYPRPADENREGNLYVLDISSPSASAAPGAKGALFLSIWYDLQAQRFNVLSSSSYRGEPTCFPVSTLCPGVWHHVLLTYTPSKRTMMGRKSVFVIYVDGRPLEADVRVESVNLPPNSRMIIGAPNPAVAVSGVVRGMLPIWDLGPTLMLSTVLMELDATAMFIFGPDFQGVFWGDRPQRLSLSATGTAAFAQLSETGEPGSVASALRRRDIARLEAAGTVSREMGLGGPNDKDNDSLSSLGLLCTIPPDCVVFAYRAASSAGPMQSEVDAASKRKRGSSEKLINMARLNISNEVVSTDAAVYGKAGIVTPRCFADNVQWVGGPEILMPVVNAASSSGSLALALRLIRASTSRHPPNLEAMQGGGGFQMLAVLLQGKRFVDESVLDQAFAFAVHGFDPISSEETSRGVGHKLPPPLPQASDFWVFSDLDAMKQLLLNHQVWDLKSSGPDLPLRLLSFLNGLVGQKSIHKAFNSRRLHLVGIVRWTLHLMIEAAELYTSGELAMRQQFRKRSLSEESTDLMGDPQKGSATSSALSNGWYSEAPNVDAVAVGGDPDNPLLQACKTLLRRVLTFMLTPGDLDAIVETTMYTVCIGGYNAKTNAGDRQKQSAGQGQGNDPADIEKLLPGPVGRIYLLRLIEELIVDGVNEIVASAMEKKGDGDPVKVEPNILPHAGGIGNPNQTYLSLAMVGGSIRDGIVQVHPKHQQAQNFLSAFAGVLTPVWFAALLEGCHEEATASAVLRLMIVMLQSSPSFAAAFAAAGGFAPLVLSIPKFSTCSGIIISLLSQVLHVSILHLPCFPALDSSQLIEVFDSESELSELLSAAYIRRPGGNRPDPSCGSFALLAECMGRNIQLIPFDNHLGRKALQTNMAILELLSHRHSLSPAFQEYCRTPDFLEPLAQALCLVHDERLQRMQNNQTELASSSEAIEPGPSRKPTSRRGALLDTPTFVTATERFVGSITEDAHGTGIGMVVLLRLVVSHSVMSGPIAAPLVSALFRSFPIHASPEQVEGYHLVLIELCKSVFEDAIDLGEATALASSVGVCSVLLNRLMSGCFTSEPTLQTVNMIIALLKCVTSSDSLPSRSLATVELAMISADAAHIARLTCLSALRRSRPLSPDDAGDPDLQSVVLEKVAKNIEELMTVPKSNGNQRKGATSNLHQAPPSNSNLRPLWSAASLTRCSPTWAEVLYPDLSDTDEPLRLFVIGLMVEIQMLLRDPRDSVRENAIAIVVALIQQRRGIMSGILIKEIQQGDRVEIIDVMNRGGFGALLVAHEAATSAGGSSSKKNYASFFEWFGRHQAQVQLVFDGIQEETKRLFPGLEMGAATPAEAVENEQKVMVLRLASQESADRTIIGGLERAGLAQLCIDRTSESHVHWKRQGFDDLASGAMQWKFLLRRLKGSCSIWEGGLRYENRTIMARHQQLYSGLNLENGTTPVVTKEDEEEENTPEVVTRWKLDLTEGNERQRRRLLPNYEFDSLYNVDETADHEALATEADQGIDEKEDATDSGRQSELFIGSAGMHAGGSERQSDFFVGGTGMEATAALLKELNLKAVNRKEEDDDYFDDADETEATTATGSSLNDSERMSKADSAGARGKSDDAGSATDGVEFEDHQEADNASSYELITGLLQAGDWPEESYNVQRCTGLEVRKALLLWCRDAIYVIDGFEQTDGEGLEGKITRVEKEHSSYNINLRPKDFKVSEEGIGSIQGEGGEKVEEKNKASKKPTHDSSNEVTYQHKSQRIAFSDLHSVFRRRYQLQQIALEFYDIHSNGTLISFANHSEREAILSKVLGSTLPNSIFSSSYGTSINYKKFMSSLKSKIVSQWCNGKLTNFEFLMHLNSFAGRTYNDLTQYPVFPWVIADYDSEEIDLEDPKTYRDLSKPMGALGEERAKQFRDRYEALEANYFNDDETPPFHYGTHYSCAAYVLYYLMRLEPFSRLALTLQGGRFDVADRLFHNVGSSWKSASVENLQDVRELIPEFYYLPDFLTNTNHFDFGTTQKGKTVHDVSLPKWAKGDPNRFVRINRQALESDHVSRNLHKWIDLVFGYKQRGEEAVRELNTFVHVTYEGEVDLDAMTDPVQRESTIAQIQNFGQTPTRLERKPFPQRFVFQTLKNENIDFGSLPYLAPLTPPFCVVGAAQRCQVKRTLSDACKLGIIGQADKAVGDMCLVKGQLIGVGRMCALNIPQKKYYRYGGPNNGLSVHVASTTARNRELNKMLSIHDGLHRSEISVAKASLDGQWLVTGCVDSTVRVWKYDNQTVHLCDTLCGHGGWKITCLDVSTEFGTIATGCAHGAVLLWDLRTLTFVRRLRHSFKDESDIPSGMIRPTSSLSINHKNGNIITLVDSHLSIFDINGNLLGTENSLGARPSCVVATDCPEWMEQGIVAVTGHVNGEVRFWSLNYDNREMTVRHLMVDREHTCEITALRVTGVDRQDTLLVGDESGKMSVCKTIQIENMNQKELAEVVAELRTNLIKVPSTPGDLASSSTSFLSGQSSVSDT
jgi:hypothetical protein